MVISNNVNYILFVLEWSYICVHWASRFFGELRPVCYDIGTRDGTCTSVTWGKYSENPLNQTLYQKQN